MSLWQGLSHAKPHERVPETMHHSWPAPKLDEFDEFQFLLNEATFAASNATFMKGVNTLQEYEAKANRKSISKDIKMGTLKNISYQYLKKSIALRNKLLLNYRNKLRLQGPFAKTKPSFNYGAIQAQRRKAIRAFRKLFNSFRSLNRDPKYLYLMGALQLPLTNSNAELFFKKAIKKASGKGAWALKSTLALAELHFAKGKIQEAQKLYFKAYKAGSPGERDYAVYKMSWINAQNAFKSGTDQKLYKDALLGFKKVAMKKQSAYGPNAAKFLRYQASNDLSWLFSKTSNLSSARSYFISLNQDKSSYFNTIETVAINKLKSKDLKKSAQLYRELFKLDGQRPHQIGIRLHLIDEFIKNKQASQAVLETKLLVQYLLRNGKLKQTFTAKPNSEIAKQVHNKLLEKAESFKSLYEQSKQADLLAASILLYQGHLTLFPNSAKKYQVRFQLANTLSKSGKLQEAANVYNYITLNSVKSPHREKAANSMVDLQLSIAQAAKEPTPSPAALLKLTQPTKIPTKQLKYIGAAKTYLKFYPNRPNSSKTRLNMAKILYKYGYFKEAFKNFETIIVANPAAKEAESAIQTIINHFIQRNNRVAVVEWSEKFLKLEAKLSKTLSKSLKDNLHKAVWISAEQLQKEGKLEASAGHFVKYQQKFPKTPKSDLALFRAMNLYFKAKNLKMTTAVGETLLKFYPKSKNAADTLQTLGYVYEKAGSLPLAAKRYESLASNFPRHKKSGAALWQAASIYKKNKQLKQAAATFGRLGRSYPEHPLTPSAFFQQAELFIALKQPFAAVKSFKMFLKRNKKSQSEASFYAQVQIFVLSNRVSDGATKSKELQGIEAQLKKKAKSFAKPARNLLARFYMSLGRIYMNSFNKISIQYRDINKFKLSIKNMQKLLSAIDQIYLKIAAIADAKGEILSYNVLGQFYKNIQSSFRKNWDLGSKMTDANKDYVMNEKERLALDLSEKSDAFYEKARLLAEQSQGKH